jgi:hypothetical protein
MNALQLPIEALEEIEHHSRIALSEGVGGMAYVTRDLAFTGRVLYAQVEALIRVAHQSQRDADGFALVSLADLNAALGRARAEVSPCADT